jgi:hypothetical protein
MVHNVFIFTSRVEKACIVGRICILLLLLLYQHTTVSRRDENLPLAPTSENQSQHDGNTAIPSLLLVCVHSSK